MTDPVKGGIVSVVGDTLSDFTAYRGKKTLLLELYGAYRIAGVYTGLDDTWYTHLFKVPIYIAETVLWPLKIIPSAAVHLMAGEFTSFDWLRHSWLENTSLGNIAKWALDSLPNISPETAQQTIDTLNNAHINPVNAAYGLGIIAVAEFLNHRKMMGENYPMTRTERITPSRESLESIIKEESA